MDYKETDVPTELPIELLDAIAGGAIEPDRVPEIHANLINFKRRGWTWEKFESFITQYIKDIRGSGQIERADRMQEAFEVAKDLW